MMASVGAGLSDGYHDAAGWLVAIDRLVLSLEAPVALVLKLLHLPDAHFSSERLFLIDYVNGSNGLLVFALCALWSVIVGYACAFLLSKYKTAVAAGGQQAGQQPVAEDYQGPRCVSCRKPIEPNAQICPACGWTQPV